MQEESDDESLKRTKKYASSSSTSTDITTDVSASSSSADDGNPAKLERTPQTRIQQAINPNGPMNQLFSTPAKLVDLLVNYGRQHGYLTNEMTVWECCNGNGNITDVLKRYGFKVRYSDIIASYSEPELGSLDFFRIGTAPFKFDVIITNPPFAGYEHAIRTAKALGKPFIFVLPINKLVQKKFTNAMKNVKYNVFIVQPRMAFTYVDKDGVTRESNSDCFVVMANFPQCTDVTELHFVHEEDN